MKIDLVKYKAVFLGVSLLMVLASVFAIYSFGFKLGIDFTGGSLWQLKIAETDSPSVKTFFEEDLKHEVSSVSYDESSDTYAVTFNEITDEERQADLAALQAEFSNVEDVEFLSISPSVSEEIKSRAMYAIVFVLLGISLYIAFVFRKVSKPISSWKYGAITLLTLLHDVIVPAGVFAYLSYRLDITIDTNFIVALLVVMGFSVHDTIVVFDRIREHLLKSRSRNLGEIVNTSVNETLRRSINTSLTLIIVLVSLFFLGPLSLKFFVLAMLIGTVVGTYSSIFVASPLLVLVQKFSRNS